jgi:hypothetical protein
MWACDKHTQYHILCLLSFTSCHMVYLAIHEIMLPLWLVLICTSRNCLSSWALSCKVTSQPTLEIGSAIMASLSWCILGGWSGWARALLYVMVRRLLHTSSMSLGLRLLHLEVQALHLKVQSLHMEWRILSMHRWANHTRVSEERSWLRQARLGVASYRLSQEWCFPVVILLHLFNLAFTNDTHVDHLLEILIVGIEKLELNLVVEPIQEGILFLFIHINLIRCIPWHLSEFIEVLIHSHFILLQFRELLF